MSKEQQRIDRLDRQQERMNRAMENPDLSPEKRASAERVLKGATLLKEQRIARMRAMKP